MSDSSHSDLQSAVTKLVNYFRSGDFTNALQIAGLLVQEHPEQVIGWNAKVAVLAQTDRKREALEYALEAAARFPDDPDPINNLANLQRELGLELESEASYKKTIALQPKHPEANYNLGSLLCDLHRFDEAEPYLRTAIESNEGYAEAYNNLANLLSELNRLAEAEECYRKVVELKPLDAQPLANLSVLMLERGYLEKALQFSNAALSRDPASAEALSARGSLMLALGRLGESRENYEKSLEANSEYVKARYNLGILLLTEGDLVSGFALYENRLQMNPPTARLPRPNLQWDGKADVAGKRFLVYEEQGLGDTIQFCRYLVTLSRMSAEVTFEVDRKLHRLLQPLPAEINLVDQVAFNERFDYELPLLSLPHAISTVVSEVPYLSPESDIVKSWGRRLDSQRFKVGICWQGSLAKVDVGRSFPLSCFKSIASIPDVELISLHRGAGESQLADVEFEVTSLGEDFDGGLDAFIDTAAVMRCCDLIITSDTAVAHLAGAIGKPVWVVLKAIPDWRWMLDRKDSPWYPSMRLYRQVDRGDWKGVFEKIAQDLESEILQTRMEK